ncbi:MAG TPA: hypothetical protein VGK58_11215, partial [Lacipirellulaceae bacterium]
MLTQHNLSIPRAANQLIAALALVTIAFLPATAPGLDYTWDGMDSVWDGNPVKWDPNGVPGNGDNVFFETANDVTLGQNLFVDDITLSDGVDLDTQGFLLGGDLLTLSDGGTDLIVDPRTINPNSPALDVDRATINSGARITLLGSVFELDGTAGTGLLNMNIGSTLRGWGEIELDDSIGSVTTLMDMDGTLTVGDIVGITGTPVARTLTINSASTNARLDLDGSGGGGDGIVNVNRNGTLDINVPLSDTFDGTINLAANATLDIASPWTLNGTINVNSGASGAIVPLPAAPTRIAGGDIYGFGGTITLDHADEVLIFDAPYTQAGTTINNSGTIIFNAFAQIFPVTDFLMTGSNASLTVNPGVTVNMAADDFDLDGNGTATNVTTIGSGGTLNIAGSANDIVTGVINLNGGTLNRNDPDDWVLGGTVNVGAGTGVSQIGGDAVTFGANTTVGEFATLQFNAPITVNSSTTMVNAGANLVLAGPITFNNAPGIITGPGTVTQAHNATVIGNSGVTVSTYDWDGGSTTVNPGVTFTLEVDHIDTGGSLTNDTHNHTINNHGTISVTVADGEWELGTAGDLNFNYTAPASLPTLEGSQLRVVPGGRIDVNGRAHIEAPLILEEGSTPGTGTAVTIVGVGSVGIEEATVVFAGGLTLAGGDVLDTINRNTLDSWMSVSNGLMVTGISTIDVETIRWDASSTTIERTGELSLIADHIEDVGPAQQHDGTIRLNGGKLMVNLGAHDTWITDGLLDLNNTLNSIPIVSGPDTIQVGDDAGSLDADINVGGTGQSTISAPLTFMSDADVNIAAGALLYTSGTTTFNSDNGLQDAEFTGAGTWLIGGTTTFIEATTVDMPTGTIDLDGGADDNIGNTINVNREVTMNLGALASFGQPNLFGSQNTVQIGVAGSLTVNLTDPDGEWTVNAPGVITYNGGASNNLFLRGSDINMNGTLNVNGEGQITARMDIGSSGDVNINSPGEDLNFNGGSILDPNRINGGTINGPGVLSLNIGHALFGFGTINANVAAGNTAELRADGDGQTRTLTVNGTMTDVGVIGTADADGILNMTNAWNTNVADAVELLGGELVGAEITNDNLIRGFGLVSVSQLINNGTISAANDNTLILDRAVVNAGYDWDGTSDNGTLEAVNGNLHLRAGGFFPFSGTINVGLGRELFVEGLNFVHDPDAIVNLAGGVYRSDTLQEFAGTINVNTAISEVNAPSRFFAGSANNINADLQLRQNSMIAAGATFSGAGTLINLAGGTLTVENGANIGVELQNQGTLVIGASPGQISVDDYTQAATGILEIELAGLVPGTEYDRLNIAGVATLDGTLDVSLLNGFMPSAGDMFLILSAAGGITGTFATEILPTLNNGLFFDVRYDQSAVSLLVALTGDFNADGTVDATDYAVWRKTDGSQQGYD